MQKEQKAREMAFRKYTVHPLPILQIQASPNFGGTGLLNAGCFACCRMGSSRTQK